MELLKYVFSSFWIFFGVIILLGMIIKTIIVLIALVTKTPLDSEKYTKQDLRDAWNHGEFRRPEEFKYLNNFDAYFEHKYKKDES